MLYELPSFKRVDARTIEEAVALLHRYGEKARPIAGGTDLLGLMKDEAGDSRRKSEEVLVNIKNIPGLNRIIFDEGRGLRIGAAVTLSQLEASGVISGKFTILRQAVQLIGSTQIRNMATVGGNLCQDPRCMYFRHVHFLCHKKGGNRCFAVRGEHRDYYSIFDWGKCIMAHPSDLAPALVALRAKLNVAGYQGERQVLLENFFPGPADLRKTVLEPGELISEIEVPIHEEPTYQQFLKHRMRRSFDFALSSVSVVARISHKICHDIRIVLGGVAPFPYHVLKAGETVKGKRLGEDVISEAAGSAVEEARPLPMNRYKVDVTRALVARTLKMIWHESLSQEPPETSG